MKKRTLSLVFAVALTFAVLCMPAFALVDKSSDFYVADYSNVLSADTKSDIINYNGALEKQCDGAQIVIVTVDYLDGMSSSEYATQLFNNWGVGSSEHNNGVLLLLAIKENKYYVEYGTGLTGTSFETEVGGKMSKFEKYFDGGEYDKAVSYIFGEMMNWFDNEYGSAVASSGSSSSGNYTGYDGQSSYHNNVFSYGGIISLVVRLFIIYFFVAAIFRSFRRSYHTHTGNWLPLFLLFGPRIPYWGFRPGSHYDPNNFNDWDDHHHGGFGGGSGFGGGGFGGGGFGGGGGGFGGGMGGGGGGFGGGGFGRN